jgi:hypothetical protein
MVAFVDAVQRLVGRAVERGLKLFCDLRDALVEARRQRAILAGERFRGHYNISFKNDGDRPIVR